MKLHPLLERLFDVDTIRVRRIPSGMFNDSYFLTADSKEYVLRIAPAPDTPVLFYEKAMMRREPGIHTLVRAHTNAPVADIVEYDFTGSTVVNDWLLMERLPGSPISDAPLWGKKAEYLFFQLGETLRQVHSIKNSWYGYPEGTDTGPRETDWFRAFRNMWHRLLVDVASTGLYDGDEQLHLDGLLLQHQKSFQHHPAPSLLHMDIWSQNILASPDGELYGLVDWDRGMWGDPEIEFSVLEYCGTSPEAFWEGYGVVPDRSGDFDVRRLFYLLYEHQKYIYIRAKRSNSPGVARKYARESLEMARRLE